MSEYADTPNEHRAGSPRPGPADIAAARFDRVRRDGLNPANVYPYLLLIADEMTTLLRELAIATEENERLKTALAAWQAQLSPAQTPDGYLGHTVVPRPLRHGEADPVWNNPTAEHHQATDVDARNDGWPPYPSGYRS